MILVGLVVICFTLSENVPRRVCSICIAGWPWPVLVVSVLWAYNNHIQWKSSNVDTIGTGHAYDYLVYEGVRGFHLNFFMYGNTHWLSVQHGHISAALA